MRLLQYILRVAGLKTTWKLQLEQDVVIHEINSAGSEAHSTTTFSALNFPPSFIWLQSGSVRQLQAACLCGRGSILEQLSCAGLESETGDIGQPHCIPWQSSPHLSGRAQCSRSNDQHSGIHINFSQTSTLTIDF